MNLIYINPSKLVLNLSIHEKPISVKPKTEKPNAKYKTCVCSELEHINYLVFTHGSKTH